VGAAFTIYPQLNLPLAIIFLRAMARLAGFLRRICALLSAKLTPIGGGYKG
jgi:hypothetical protein